MIIFLSIMVLMMMMVMILVAAMMTAAPKMIFEVVLMMMVLMIVMVLVIVTIGLAGLAMRWVLMVALAVLSEAINPTRLIAADRSGSRSIAADLRDNKI